MSFSKNVKEELANQIPKSRHCRIAELAAIVNYAGRISLNENDLVLNINPTEDLLVRKYFTLLNKTLNIKVDVTDHQGEVFLKIKEALKLSEDGALVDDLIIQQPCCKRAYIRGAFLAAGSISDPNKGYHFEIVAATENQAKQLIRIINSFDVQSKMVRRSGKFVVYLKEGAQIVEALRIMEASHSVMDLENIRIVKEVRGTINRKVNCETANIGKTVNAALRQIEDIKFLEAEIGLETLPESLQLIAELRLANPDTPLQDLGQLMDPPLGKSGVNHRLKRISVIADSYRDN